MRASRIAARVGSVLLDRSDDPRARDRVGTFEGVAAKSDRHPLYEHRRRVEHTTRMRARSYTDRREAKADGAGTRSSSPRSSRRNGAQLMKEKDHPVIGPTDGLRSRRSPTMVEQQNTIDQGRARPRPGGSQLPGKTREHHRRVGRYSSSREGAGRDQPRSRCRSLRGEAAEVL